MNLPSTETKGLRSATHLRVRAAIFYDLPKFERYDLGRATFK
ncbi:hypothetical protein MEA186_02714, partial [Mesorhizobium amorphae CCNWGS0123]